MRRSLAALAAALLLSPLVGCGGGRDNVQADDPSSVTSADQPTESATVGDATDSPSTSAPADPQYKEFTEKELRAELLTISDLPPGYSAEPPDDGSTDAKYCGFKPDKAPNTVSQDFTKGAGFTSELAGVTLSQYPSVEVASNNLERLRLGLRTCKGETVTGDEVTYAVMSTPEMEHPTLGIRITSDNFTVLLNIAQVGPTVVVAGTGGLSTADADLAAQLLTQQVDAYKDAALQ